MKTCLSTFLLAGALLLATAFPTHAQSAFGDAGNLDLEEEVACEVPDYDFSLAKSSALPDSAHSPAPTQSLLQQQVEALTNENLALDYRVGTLQAQVELLSRRLTVLEDAAAPAAPPATKAYN